MIFYFTSYNFRKEVKSNGLDAPMLYYKFYQFAINLNTKDEYYEFF